MRLLPEIELEKIQATLAGAEAARRGDRFDPDALFERAHLGARARSRRCANARRSSRASPSRRGTTIVFVGHVTKEGALAGPRVLEHMVDTVLYFEGETHTSFRLIRAFKNRFGAVNEIGVFAMTEKGLREVTNPSALFLSQHHAGVAGSCVMVTQEGTRPLLVELQALVDESHGGAPKRLAVGLEQNRLAMLLAVLHRHAGIACFDQDVFLNAVGGVRIAEPGADLAVTLAVVSSLRNRPLPEKHVVFGEVGLAGEVRPVQRGQERLREAAKLGFTHAIIPAANKPQQPIAGLAGGRGGSPGGGGGLPEGLDSATSPAARSASADGAAYSTSSAIASATAAIASTTIAATAIGSSAPLPAAASGCGIGSGAGAGGGAARARARRSAGGGGAGGLRCGLRGERAGRPRSCPCRRASSASA